MKKGIFAKLSGQSFRARLFRTVCILFVLLVVTAWSVSGVYAKYVDSASVNGTADLAKMGISTFELLEHKAIDVSGQLDKITDEGTINFDSLYELDYESEVLTNTYSTVIPGIDIPKDPFINLVLESNEVNYQLYLIVTESGFTDEEGNRLPITYGLTEDWEPVEGKTDLYKFTGKKSGVDGGLFEAGTPYTFTSEAGHAIQILKDNKIKVSQYFNSELVDGKPIEFSITFTAYLEQVLVTSANNNNNNAEGGDESGD